MELRNFRAFRKQSVEFAPLTILVGPNNAGKSSILSAIRVLAQTVQSADWDVPLLLGEFGTFRDIAFGNKSTRVVGMTLGLRVGTKRSAVKVNFKYRAQRRETIVRDLTICDGKNRPLLSTAYLREGERQTITSIRGIAADLLERVLRKPVRLFHFLPRIMPAVWELDRVTKGSKLALSHVRRLAHVENISRETNRLLQSVEYLGPFREAPLRLYPFSGERPSVVGPTGRGATDILVADYFRRGTRKQELSKLVRDWLAKAEIANDLEVRALSDRHYDIRLQHAETGETENLKDVGYGISQVLPVIVGGYNLRPASVFIVEQPEMHLHPRAQAELGDFFFDLYQRKVQCIVETHSEHLIMRLQTHVARGRIPPGDITVNYVMAGKRAKHVVKLPLNADGVFQRKWPQGFFEERLVEALELARAPLRRKGEIE